MIRSVSSSSPRPRGRELVHGGLRALAAGLLLVGAGCSVSPPGPDAGEGSDPSSSAPDFGGPWAAEFADMYARATTDFERAALADELISDPEHAEMRSRFTECLSSFGGTEISFSPDGAFSVTMPDGADEEKFNDDVSECSDVAGESTIGALHSWISRNPANLDESTIMAACLVRSGAVDASYSAREYSEDLETDTLPVDVMSPEFGRCNADPLGLFE